MSRRTENHLRRVLADALADLERLKDSVTLLGLEEDAKLREVEYALFRAIGACLEWASKAVGPSVVPFDEGLTKLTELGFIDSQLKTNISARVEMRNALAHLSEELTPERVFNAIQDVRDLHAFALAIRDPLVMNSDPWPDDVETKYVIGTQVLAEVQEVQKRYVLVKVGKDVEGEIPLSEISSTKVGDDARALISRGPRWKRERVKAVVIGIDRRGKRLKLSMKRLDSN